MRGLKPKDGVKFTTWKCRIFYRCVDWNLKNGTKGKKDRVASFTDAWIETIVNGNPTMSTLSHLLQMRGLKQSLKVCWAMNEVASFTDAWIETSSLVPRRCSFRRIFYRCVDWNFFAPCGTCKGIGRIFYRCVDWNLMARRLIIVG